MPQSTEQGRTDRERQLTGDGLRVEPEVERTGEDLRRNGVLGRNSRPGAVESEGVVLDGDEASGPYFVRWPLWQPAILIIAVSIIIRFFDIDRRVSSLFYDAANRDWPFRRIDPWYSLYNFGTYPPLALGVVWLCIGLWCRRIWPTIDDRRAEAIHRGGLFLGLMLLIGPGLIVNGGFKSWWGRPRPEQCKEFGGEMTFRQVGEWARQSAPNSSFPSGHASIAFFLMGPGFLVAPKRQWLRSIWFLTGCGYGVLMSVTRILQGGHFLSDVLWAGVIVYFVGAILARRMISFD